MKTVFLAVTHGWQARLLLRSTFLPHLLSRAGRDVRVVVLTPNADEPYFREEFGDRCELRAIGPQSSRILQRYDWIRRSLLLDAKPSTSHQILMNVQRHTAPKRYWVIRALNACFRRSRFARRLFRALDRRLLPDRQFEALFTELKPDLLVIASTVHNEAFHLLRRAKTEGVPTLFIVESWDNPTCKMSFIEYPEHYVVWNHIMRRELEEFHGIPTEQIAVTGSAYHDIYAKSATFRRREELAAEYGMDPAARWIVIAGTLETLYPDFDRFIADLERRRAKGEFGPKCQILIRPHPQAIAGYSRGHGVAELRKLREQYPAVFYDVPAVLSQKLPVDVETADIARLAEILTHADVVISFLSTVTIDACAADTPVVLAGFDDYGHMTWFPTMGKRLQFDHHRNVVASGAVRIGRCFDEIAAHLRGYLEDPSLDREGRRRLVAEQCFRLDGESGRRMADAVMSALHGTFTGGEAPASADAMAVRVPSHAL